MRHAWWSGVLLFLLPSAEASAAKQPHEAVTVVRASETVGATQQADNVLLTPASGQRLVLMGCTVCTGSAVDVELEESDADILFLESLNGCVTVGGGPVPVYVSTTTDDTFDWSTGGATTTAITCWGYGFIP